MRREGRNTLFHIAPYVLLLVVDAHVIDLLTIGIQTSGREGEGFAVRRKCADRCLDHFSGLGPCHLHRRIVDYSVGSGVVGGRTGYGVRFPVVKVWSKNRLGRIALRVDTLIGGSQALPDRLVRQSAAPWRRTRIKF